MRRLRYDVCPGEGYPGEGGEAVRAGVSVLAMTASLVPDQHPVREFGAWGARAAWCRLAAHAVLAREDPVTCYDLRRASR
jgi:hypothetical protein